MALTELWGRSLDGQNGLAVHTCRRISPARGSVQIKRAWCTATTVNMPGQERQRMASNRAITWLLCCPWVPLRRSCAEPAAALLFIMTVALYVNTLIWFWSSLLFKTVAVCSFFFFFLFPVGVPGTSCAEWLRDLGSVRCCSESLNFAERARLRRIWAKLSGSKINSNLKCFGSGVHLNPGLKCWQIEALRSKPKMNFLNSPLPDQPFLVSKRHHECIHINRICHCLAGHY